MEQLLASELLSLWRKSLKHPELDADSNFFEFDGNSDNAREILREVERLSGRHLHPAMICLAPTVASLIRLLEQPEVRFPALTQLKPGTDPRPLFITHGFGGSILEFWPLVRYIQSSSPIYGMQAKGLDGMDEPFKTIEEIAQFFVDAIREVKPRGPYLLVGYSLGGLVTLEMAQRLLAAGEKVDLLAMLESYPARRHLSVGARMHLYGRLIRHHVRESRSMSLQESTKYLAGRARHQIPFLRAKRAVPDAADPNAAAKQRLFDSALASLNGYEPHPYHGKVRFVHAAIRLRFADDPADVWSPWISDIEVDTIPGDHDEILTTHAKELGAVISRYLNEASPQNKS
jgi:acetoacetyl-CoA synthetase